MLILHLIRPLEAESTICTLKYLHQNEESSKEQQRGPFHPVQDDLKVLDVGQDQQPQSAQHSDPA